MSQVFFGHPVFVFQIFVLPLPIFKNFLLNWCGCDHRSPSPASTMSFSGWAVGSCKNDFADSLRSALGKQSRLNTAVLWNFECPSFIIYFCLSGKVFVHLFKNFLAFRFSWRTSYVRVGNSGRGQFGFNVAFQTFLLFSLDCLSELLDGAYLSHSLRSMHLERGAQSLMFSHFDLTSLTWWNCYRVNLSTSNVEEPWLAVEFVYSKIYIENYACRSCCDEFLYNHTMLNTIKKVEAAVKLNQYVGSKYFQAHE